MLAQISEIGQVIGRVAVDACGRTFIVAHSGETDLDILAERVGRILGPGTRRLAEPWHSGEVEAEAMGEIWFDGRNIGALSRFEARLLSVRWGGAAAEAARLTPVMADHLAAALKQELDRAFDYAHAQGGTRSGDWYKGDFADAFRRSVTRLIPELGEASAGTVLDTLLNQLGAV